MGRLLRAIVYMGLFTGVAVGLGYKHVFWAGDPPPNGGSVELVFVARSCAMHAQPGAKAPTIGETSSLLDDHWAYAVREDRGDWLHLQKGTTNFWIHRTCTAHHRPNAHS